MFVIASIFNIFHTEVTRLSIGFKVKATYGYRVADMLCYIVTKLFLTEFQGPNLNLASFPHIRSSLGRHLGTKLRYCRASNTTFQEL